MPSFGLRTQKTRYFNFTKKAYDDRMIANIELKSLDFDDENFSPVFKRETQEYFLSASDKLKSDQGKVC